MLKYVGFKQWNKQDIANSGPMKLLSKVFILILYIIVKIYLNKINLLTDSQFTFRKRIFN